MRQYPFIYSQRDSAWAGNQLGTVSGATIGQYGCILTCHAMKAGYYNHEIKPNALNDIYTQRGLYINGDLLSDADLHAVFGDIQLTDVKDYSSTPADLNYLKQLASDPTVTVTIEVDFDHDPNDGIQTHFVELHDYDGTNLTIYDPWYGSDDNFTLHYGTNLAQTIQKFAVYKGTPVAPGVVVDAATFQKLVTNSSSNDAVCDELGLPHDAGKDREIADIKQLKLEIANQETTITNLNKQIPDLEGQIKTLSNANTDLTQKLALAIAAAQNPDGLNYKDLYTKAESDLTDTKTTLATVIQTTNRQIAQLKLTSATTMDKTALWKIVLARTFGLQ